MDIVGAEKYVHHNYVFEYFVINCINAGDSATVSYSILKQGPIAKDNLYLIDNLHFSHPYNRVKQMDTRYKLINEGIGEQFTRNRMFSVVARMMSEEVLISFFKFRPSVTLKTALKFIGLENTNKRMFFYYILVNMLKYSKIKIKYVMKRFL